MCLIIIKYALNLKKKLHLNKIETKWDNKIYILEPKVKNINNLTYTNKKSERTWK